MVKSLGVTASIASRMAFQGSGRVLAAAFLRAALILAKASSMGLKSGLYGGRRRSSAPAASMTFLTARGLWAGRLRSEEHTSELQSLMRTSYAVFCLKNKNTLKNDEIIHRFQSAKKQDESNHTQLNIMIDTAISPSNSPST